LKTEHQREASWPLETPEKHLLAILAVEDVVNVVEVLVPAHTVVVGGHSMSKDYRLRLRQPFYP
jgi:hypothetical protein